VLENLILLTDERGETRIFNEDTEKAARGKKADLF
jgi:hypothetical protein